MDTVIQGEVRKLLKDKRERLRARVLGITRELQADREKASPEDGGAVVDGVKASAPEFRQRDLLAIRIIDEAMESLDGGCYGTCVDCGEKISDARMKAHPEATRCINCQDTWERAGSPRNDSGKTEEKEDDTDPDDE